MKIDKKFKIAILLGILVVILVAFIDIQGINLIGQDYTKGIFDISVWYHHLITALILFSIIPLCYYFFYRKDKSEAVGIYSVSLILFYFGLADIFYFWLRGVKIPKLLPWLNNHPFIGGISEFFGYSVVTGNSLVLSVLSGIIIAFFVVRGLKKI